MTTAPAAAAPQNPAPGSSTPGGGHVPPDPSASGGQPSATGAPAHNPSDAYRPEGLPDHLFGGSNNETIDRLWKAFDGYRKAEGDRGAVPEKPEGYGFDASDKLKPFVQHFDQDPVYGAVRGIAHKAGITDKQFAAFLPAVLEHFVDGGLVEAPIDAKAQLRSLAPQEAAALSDAEKEQAAGKRVQNNTAWVDAAKADKSMPDDVADFLAAGLASDPRAHHTVEWLRNQSREPSPALSGGGSPGSVGEADFDAHLNKPEADPSHAGYRQWLTEKTALAKRIWGEGPTGG